MDRLDAVAVRVEQERAVVVVAVVRPWPGRPVVGVPGLRARLPERVDVLVRGSNEPDVEALRDPVLVLGCGE